MLLLLERLLQDFNRLRKQRDGTVTGFYLAHEHYRINSFTEI